jgi:hypothetical protein
MKLSKAQLKPFSVSSWEGLLIMMSLILSYKINVLFIAAYPILLLLYIYVKGFIRGIR